MTERYPTYSYLRISAQLKLVGIEVSPSRCGRIWLRCGLTLRIQRLLWLEQKTVAECGILTTIPSVGKMCMQSVVAARLPRPGQDAYHRSLCGCSSVAGKGRGGALDSTE